MRPTVICLTPVKNERWILERFLNCASLWADQIIIADQSSDDGSRDIARRYPRVTLIDNPAPSYDEAYARKILLEAGRRLPGPRLLIALDADEVLTSNVLDHPEWQTVLEAPVGTVIQFRLAILLPDFRSYWMSPFYGPWGIVDDSSEYAGPKVHAPRIPLPARASTISLRNVNAIHYVGVDPDRWESKHRWYQCWEKINQPWRRSADIYRQYHRKDVIPSRELHPVPSEWFLGYERQGIDMTSVYRDDVLRSDKEVLALLLQYGPRTFRREAIWDVDWAALNRTLHGGDNSQPDLSDPRSLPDRFVHLWLKRTQPHYSYFEHPRSRFSRLAVRGIQRLLRPFGW